MSTVPVSSQPSQGRPAPQASGPQGTATGPVRVVRRRRPLHPGVVGRHLFLIFGGLLSLFPFYWMAILATHKSEVIYQYPPVMSPGHELFHNIGSILDKINLWAAMANTALVACTVTFFVLFFDSLAAFAFAKFEFPARKLLFGIVLATFLLPGQLSTIPQFLIMSKIGWVGQLKAIIVPSLANAFGIFWLRQYTVGSVPDELIEAAKLDGCGFFRQYLHVCLPCVRPALAFLGMFTFIGSWNDFMWPLIVLNDPARLTLQVALSQLNTAHGTDYGMLMASALVSVLPLIIIFILGAKQFLAGISEGAVKS